MTALPAFQKEMRRIEINRIGDGFFVAFERPEDGAHCAMAIQRALQRHRVDHGFAPRVRIGLHHAEATREGADYQGREIAGADFVRARGGRVITIPLVGGLSTTAILASSRRTED